jgi:flagella basal body P-ring formation protein FlgA
MSDALKIRFSLAIGGLLCALATTGWAVTLQSHDSIRTTAETYLREQAQTQHMGNIEVTIGTLDNRLRLTQCNGVLDAFIPQGARLQGNTTVGIRCPDADGWRIYVTGKVSVLADVLVVRESLGRGSPVNEASVELVEQDISSLTRGYLDDPSQLEDKILKRAVSPGMVLTPNMLEAPRIIRRGDRVTLEASQGALAVRMQGEAVMDGRRGERIRVRSLNSKKIVEGVVTATGVIKVTL